jgi:hypothetical protein
LVEVEVKGRDVAPVRKQFAFWGDITGQYCIEAVQPGARDGTPLRFEPEDLDTLPPSMHPHQLRALEEELRKRDYDGMEAEQAYWMISDDCPRFRGLSSVRFVTPENIRQLKSGQRAVIITNEEVVKFPGGVPGFPNGIRRADFDIAWQVTRGASGS